MTYWALGSKGMVGVEFLTNLGQVPDGAYFLFAAVKFGAATAGRGEPSHSGSPGAVGALLGLARMDRTLSIPKVSGFLRETEVAVPRIVRCLIDHTENKQKDADVTS